MESAENRTLRVEFARLPAWAGWAVLAVALIFGADAAITFVRLKTDVDHAQTRIERGRAAAARRVAPEHIAAARETVQRLALPWPDLFEAIEGASSDAV